MARQVLITERAARELEAAALWWAQHRSHDQALRWHRLFVAAIHRLADEPHFYPVARESHRFEIELRQLNIGAGKRRTHRAVFTIHEEMVIVLTVRHVAQADLTSDEIE